MCRRIVGLKGDFHLVYYQLKQREDDKVCWEHYGMIFLEKAVCLY